MKRSLVATVSVALLALTAGGCASKANDAGAGPAVPPSGVVAPPLVKKRLETSNDYLATLTSRRAVALYPQVSGYIRAIVVKPGATVKAGALLIQIDAQADQAAMENLAATRESLVASAQFAKDRQARSKMLRTDGIVSQQDVDQAQVQADQAEASVRATDALMASQRARLAYFTIVAPFEGVVGNIPVKVGDFVSPGTLLTSVTQDAGLEAEVSVPIERVASLGPASRVRLLGPHDGAPLGESPVVFVSPRADPSTQLVLIKAAFEPLPSLRADQIVKARVVWQSYEGLAVPSVAVVRQAGQTFVYVVEPADGGPPTARRCPVSLGDLRDNEYAVVSGLTEGQRVVISGVQQIGDGSPVELLAGK